MPDICCYQIFTAIIVNAKVQMLFAPNDESGFFEALRAGQFDAKAVCNLLDATKANATVEADKEMILGKIKQSVGLDSFNEQLRQFLEQVGACARPEGWHVSLPVACRAAVSPRCDESSSLLLD